MSTARNAVPLPLSAPGVNRNRPRTASELYGPEYYHSHCGLPYSREYPEWLEFFGRAADQIISSLHPRTAVDLGCAQGFLVESLRDRGVDAYGVDISEYAISQVRDDVKPFCRVASVTDDIDRHYDLITCIEVCEHLTEFEARRAIRNMTSHADAVLFSSTPNDFSERTHVNVQPIIYWLRAFREFSFAPDLAFNAEIISPQAILFRHTQQKPSDQWLTEIARTKTDAVLAASRNAESQVQGEVAHLKSEVERLEAELAARTATLNAVLNSRGWKLLNHYRNLRIWILQNERLRRLGLVLFRNTTGRTLSDWQYRRWILEREQPSIDVPAIRQAISGFAFMPTISIVVPVYNTPAELINAFVNSVRAQYYENWELCICNDGSSAMHVRPLLDEWSERDSRIKVVHSGKNEGISSASNRALGLAAGEYVGLLDHDDELSPNALYENVKLLQSHPEADMIYSDEDKLNARGQRIDPFFKPDWSPEYMLSCMYTCHFGVYRKRLLNEIGGFRVGFEGSQDYDLVLRVSEKTDKIFHIPKVLYHWRIVAGSAAGSSGAKPYAYVAARKALREHLNRRRVRAEVADGKWLGHYSIRFKLENIEPVSVIIPTKDKVRLLRSCIQSIEKETSYPNYEIIIVDNQSSRAETKQYFSTLRHRIVTMEEPFNFSRLINRGAAESRAKYLLFLNNDTQVISADWIETMAGLCQQHDIGIVGGKLLYPGDRIQHAGITLGVAGIAGHAFRRFVRDTFHHFGAACDLRNCSAVTGACMMVRKEVFDQVGGFDESLPIAYNDVDFCLRVRQAGYRIVYTPAAELYHIESASRGYRTSEKEAIEMQRRWAKVIMNDPYYNPNLTLDHEDFGLRLSGPFPS